MNNFFKYYILIISSIFSTLGILLSAILFLYKIKEDIFKNILFMNIIQKIITSNWGFNYLYEVLTFKVYLLIIKFFNFLKLFFESFKFLFNIVNFVRRIFIYLINGNLNHYILCLVFVFLFFLIFCIN